MREIKFRAWAEHTTDNAINYADCETEKTLIGVEPKDTHATEWDTWYDEKTEFWNRKIFEWLTENKGKERYITTSEFIYEGFSVEGSGKIKRCCGYKVLDVHQYTGLKDKNGKEIYEGDICLVTLKYFDIKNEKAKVIFKNGSFCFQYGFNDDYVKTYNAWDADSIKVIGNIYENPELWEE